MAPIEILKRVQAQLWTTQKTNPQVITEREEQGLLKNETELSVSPPSPELKSKLIGSFGAFTLSGLKQIFPTLKAKGS